MQVSIASIAEYQIQLLPENFFHYLEVCDITCSVVLTKAKQRKQTQKKAKGKKKTTKRQKYLDKEREKKTLHYSCSMAKASQKGKCVARGGAIKKVKPASNVR